MIKVGEHDELGLVLVTGGNERRSTQNYKQHRRQLVEDTISAQKTGNERTSSATAGCPGWISVPSMSKLASTSIDDPPCSADPA